MSQRAVIEAVLGHYPAIAVRRLELLGAAGGFSGACFWRLETSDAQLCLRRWPSEHPSQHRLKFIHNLLRTVAAQGFTKLPVPIGARDDQTFVSVAGHFWELTPWLPGHADFHQHPTSERLDAVFAALAQFHGGAAVFESRTGAAPGILNRREQLQQLIASGAEEMSRAVSVCGWPEFQLRAAAILRGFQEHAAAIKSLLDLASRLQVPLQPCIRDIWHDHVLFLNDEVSGFVDFGAARVDHVACDIARLLGSLVGNERAKWDQALAQYQSWRRLTADELTLVEAYDRSTILLSGMNWVDWIAVQRRNFEDPARVLQRLDEIILRLQHP